MIGSNLSHYRITAKLGEGGMGEVYRAEDTRLGRDVAIKVLGAAFVADRERLERFEREARVLASLNHVNIGHIYGLEESDGVKALVLELVEGPTLADRIASGPMSIDEALAVAAQIAEALRYAHDQGIVHRDLKPANVKVRADGTVKVLDFGLAKALEPATAAESADLTQSPTLTSPSTQPGMILGTAPYMAPEQVEGREVDTRADLFAFGCVLYEMLTGKRAFAGGSVADTLSRILRQEPAPVGESLPAAPPRLEWVLEKCLAKDPARRYQGAGDLAADLRAVASAPMGDHDRGTASQPRPRRGPRVAIAVLVGALTLAVGFLWGRDQREILFLEGRRVMSARVSTDPVFSADPPRQLFESDHLTDPFGNPNYDVAADGRLIMIKTGGAGASRHRINVVVNWLSELEERVGAAR